MEKKMRPNGFQGERRSKDGRGEGKMVDLGRKEKMNTLVH